MILCGKGCTLICGSCQYFNFNLGIGICTHDKHLGKRNPAEFCLDFHCVDSYTVNPLKVELFKRSKEEIVSTLKIEYKL